MLKIIPAVQIMVEICLSLSPKNASIIPGPVSKIPKIQFQSLIKSHIGSTYVLWQPYFSSCVKEKNTA